MKNTLIFFFVQILVSQFYAQDTVFSVGYPKGLIVDHNIIEKFLSENKPIRIENADFFINLPKDRIYKIANSKGIVFENKEVDKRTDFVVIPTDINTGRIVYTDIIEVKGAKKKDLYEALKVLPNSSVTYNLIAKDETDYNSVTQKGFFNVKLSGDLHIVSFNINIKIKDEKIKYELSDFRLYFAEGKGMNIFGNNNYSVNPTHVKNFALETHYSSAGAKTNNLWETVINSINSTISTIKTTTSKSKSNDW